jgi:hypothetical protein
VLVLGGVVCFSPPHAGAVGLKPAPGFAGLLFWGLLDVAFPEVSHPLAPCKRENKTNLNKEACKIQFLIERNFASQL